MSIDYSRLPEHMQDAARRYVEGGSRVGDFLTAVIHNDLFGAMRHADDINRDRLRDWCSFFYNEAPRDCYGSSEAMDAWIERGGLNGRAAA